MDEDTFQHGRAKDRAGASGDSTTHRHPSDHRSQVLSEIATNLDSPEQILNAMREDKNRSLQEIRPQDMPATPTQKWLAKVWIDLLGVHPVGIHDDFFEIGGQSLLATQILSRIRSTLGIELSLQVLFEDDFTIERIARLIEIQQIANASPTEVEQAMQEVKELSDEEVAARLSLGSDDK